MMLDYTHLSTLAAVHRRGSFELAAAALAITPSAVSQRIKALEDRMGSVLIRRGHPCTATDPGLRLIRHLEDVALMEAALAQDLPMAAGALPTLRLAVNADSLATWVLPALAQVPDMLFDLVIDDQDHSQDWLRRGEVAAAITGHPGPLQGCDTVPLGALRYRATASPAFVARWMPEGATRAVLARAPAITYSDKDRLQRDWITAHTGARIMPPTHRLASSHGFVEAARLGLGWGMNPEPLVAGLLATGELCELLPDSPLDVALYWQVTRLSGKALAPLTAAIRAAAGKVLIPPV
ncbi:MAG: LysR family transcriptional regulator ArgP [Pseudorhodobacter sp.]